MVAIVSIRMGDMIGHGSWFRADVLPHHLGPYSTYFTPTKRIVFSSFYIKTLIFAQKNIFFTRKASF